MAFYDYETILAKSNQVNWKVDEVLGVQELDYSKPFLPESLVRTKELDMLSNAEKLKLNHIRGYSYAHLFRYLEGFIVSEMMKHAQQHVNKDEQALAALINFCNEELKHRQLFAELKKLFDRSFDVDCKLIGREKETAAYFSSVHPLAHLLLTLCIEVFTQLHYLESFHGNILLERCMPGRCFSLIRMSKRLSR